MCEYRVEEGRRARQGGRCLSVFVLSLSLLLFLFYSSAFYLGVCMMADKINNYNTVPQVLFAPLP